MKSTSPHPHRVEAYYLHLPDAYSSRSAELASSRSRKLGNKITDFFFSFKHGEESSGQNFSPSVTTKTSPHSEDEGSGFLGMEFKGFTVRYRILR